MDLLTPFHHGLLWNLAALLTSSPRYKPAGGQGATGVGEDVRYLAHHKRRPLKRIRQGHQLLQEVFLLCERVEIQGHQVLHLPEHIS